MICDYVIVLLLLPVVFASKFPDAFKRCKINDADLDNCLRTTIENALKLLSRSNIPSIYLPKINPLEVDAIYIGAGTSAMHFSQNYSQVKVYGFDKATIPMAHLDWKQKVLHFQLFSPLIQQKSKYSIDGNLLVFPVSGNGDAVIDLYDLKMDHTLSFEEVTKGDKKFLKLKSYKLVYSTPSKVHTDLTNLFNGDEMLSTNILKVFNENGILLFEDSKEGLDKSYAAVFGGVAKAFFDKVPHNEIFLQ